MDTDKMREEFETSPKFRGMDFSRSSTHPDYYESPYANGAWDGWQASRETVVVELPQGLCMFDMSGGRAPGGLPLIELKQAADAIEAAGLKYEVKP